MLEHVAELVRRDDPQVDCERRCGSTTRAPASPRRARPRSSSSSSRERLVERARVVRRRDDVEVLAGVGHAARAAGDLDAVGGRVRAQLLDDLLAERQHAPTAGRAGAGPSSACFASASSDVLLGLRPQARDRAQALAARPPRAAPRASRCRAPRRSCARSSAPRPGSCVKLDQLAGELRASASRPPGSRPSRAAPRSSPASVLPTPCSSVGAALLGELRDGDRRLAHRPGRLRGRRRPGRRPRRRARTGRPARPGRLRSRRSSSQARYATILPRCRADWPPGPGLGRPAHLQRAREPGAAGRGGARGARRRSRPTTRCWSWTTPPRTAPGELADGLAAARPARAGPAPAAQARASGQAYIAGFRLALARGRRAGDRDGRRLLPRSRPTCRR